MANPQSVGPGPKGINIPGASPGKKKCIVAIAGGKGGVGKTIITSVLGAVLAENNKRTIVIDLDFGGANLHQALGIISPPCTLTNFISQNICDLASLKLETSIPNLSLVAGAAGTLYASHVQYWIKHKVVRHIRCLDSDYVLLDIGAGNSFNQLDYFNFADHGIIVVTPEPLAIQDAYNFIKLSLFRKIVRDLAKVPVIRHQFRDTFSANPQARALTVQDIVELAASHGEIALHIVKESVKSFRPSLIFNMLETSDDYNECYALQIAIKDILKIKPRYLGYVRYDDQIRRAAKMMRPDLMFGEQVDAANDVRNIAREFFFNAKPLESAAVDNFVSQRKYQGSTDEKKEIVCSIQCHLWSDCSMQNGGMLCRIPVIGYINQKRAE